MSKYDPSPKVDAPIDQLNRDLMRADKEVRRQITDLVKVQGGGGGGGGGRGGGGGAKGGAGGGGDSPNDNE